MAVYVDANSVQFSNTTFHNNQNVISVDLRNTAWVNNQMYMAFFNCSNLQTVSNINNNVINMSGTFAHCHKLVNTPIIPNSVTNMRFAFEFCTNLSTAPTIPNSVIDASGFLSHCSQFFSPEKYPEIPQSVQKLDNMFEGMTTTATDVPQWCMDKWNNCSANVKTSIAGMFQDWGAYIDNTGLVNAPTIPNSVTNMFCTFSGCSNLVNAPTIPNSVTDIRFTFARCYKLVNAPVIPNSVTNMACTFMTCNHLTGNIYIHSSNITSVNDCFKNTTLTKNVYIPFTYENSEYTKTYNSFIAAGYDENGTSCGVYLKDLNAI